MIYKVGMSILTMFGIGYFKYAPGTLASLVTCLIFYFLVKTNNFGPNYNYIIIILIFILIYSIIFIDKFAYKFKKKDPSEIVIDEFIGQSIVILFAFFLGGNVYIILSLSSSQSFLLPYILELELLLAFILFRIFDILKPFPINIIDKKIKNGLGVMLDDVVAAIYASITFAIIKKIILLWL